jgi:GT2 family glycosyltransferase
MEDPKRIVAVVVLYKMTFAESRSLTSLRTILSEDEAPARTIGLMVCDNTPHKQVPPADYSGNFYRDVTNPGLAHWYNLALKAASESAARWIMLLDQDTEVTAEYIAEAITQSEIAEADRKIIALVPKLLQDGVVCSPLTPPTYRHPLPFDKDFTGIAAQRLHVFNSGAIVRVSALQAAGGFPQDFPLDYLDHATFSALQSRDGRLFVMGSSLEHSLSSSNVRRTDTAAVARHRSILLAERKFYQRNGSVRDRLYRRVRLLRGAMGVLIRHGAVAWSFRMMKAALR